MAAQFPDSIQYNGEAYAIAGLRGNGLLDLSAMGVHSHSYATACYRGYVSHYECKDDFLTLQDFTVFTGGAKLQDLHGIQPSEVLHGMASCYSGLKLPCPLDGDLVVVRDYSYREFGGVTPQPAAYHIVKELRFINGRLVEELDHSKALESIRIQLAAFEQRRQDEDWTDEEYDEYRAAMWSFAPDMEEQPPF